MNTQNKICVYAICKNESKFVKQWLDSMSEADYIVVLDTGSTDNTYELLKEDSRVTCVQQEVINPWRFDVARTKSMELIPEDANILVCTDFDEIFDKGWAEWLRNNWIEGYHTCCWYPYVWGHGEQGENQFVFQCNKIHDRGYKWVFPVHEVLQPIEGKKVNILMAGDNIWLHHWQDKEKSRSNYLDLLKLAVEENPQSSHIITLYGRELIHEGQSKEAVDVLFKSLSCPDSETADDGLNLLLTIFLLGVAYFELEEYDICKWYCEEFIRVNPTYREPYFLMARALYELKVYTLIPAIVQAGIENSTYKCNWVESGNSWNYEADIILSYAYISLEKYNEAIPHLQTILKYEPNNNEFLRAYTLCLEKLLENKID